MAKLAKVSCCCCLQVSPELVDVPLDVADLSLPVEWFRLLALGLHLLPGCSDLLAVLLDEFKACDPVSEGFCLSLHDSLLDGIGRACASGGEDQTSWEVSISLRTTSHLTE